MQVAIVGGSGFLGRHVVKRCVAAGFNVRVLCRHPQHGHELETLGFQGQVTLVRADITKPLTLEKAFAGIDVVVNLVSILYERGTQRFEAINIAGARAVAEQAAQAQVKRFIHISALGIEQIDARYAVTKREGEKALRAAFPQATILRPSLIVGAGDGFFGRFLPMSKYSPFLPLIDHGGTLFQPVLASDVAEAIFNAMTTDSAAGRTYAIAGSEVFSFRALLELMLMTVGRKRMLLYMPTPIARLLGTICEQLPIAPVITRDQVLMLACNSVDDGTLPGLKDLGIVPRSIVGELEHLLS